MQNLIMRAKTLFSNRLSDRLLWSVMWCVFWSSERTNGEDKISIMYIQLWHQFTYIVRRFQHERMIEFFVFIRKTSAIISITGYGRRTDDRCHSVGRKQTFQFDCAEIRWGPIEHNSNTFIAGNPIANGRLTQLWKSHRLRRYTKMLLFTINLTTFVPVSSLIAVSLHVWCHVTRLLISN